MPAQRSSLAIKAWILGSVAAGLLMGFPFGSAFAQEPLVPRVTAGKKPAAQLQAIASTQQLVVKFREGSAVRIRGGSLLASETGVAASFEAVLADLDVPLDGLRRMHSIPESELDAERAAGEQASGRQLADLNLYYILDIPAGLDPATVAARLNALAGIEFAEPMPLPPPPPVDIAPTTPDLTSGQTYKNSPPGGIGADQVSGVAGSNGLNMAFADVEYSWQLDHEDLELPPSRIIVRAGCTPVDPFGDTNHGTAVLGEIVGGANGYGVTGIAPASTARMSPANCSSGFNPAAAISAASAALSPGDVIVIEQQFPACGGACGASQVGCGPLEAWQPAYDAIAAATAAGRVVAAAAGNGSVDLDSPSCGNLFNRSVRDSGAIIVGAGSPSDHSRLSFSSFGSRVDVQGWGSSVTTTGYGAAFDPGDVRQRYTNFFSGTSSATPIVSGAVLAIQGIRKACGLGVATSTQVRAAMASTGTPQGVGAAGNIGPLPRIREAVTATGAGACLPAVTGNDSFANPTSISLGQTLSGANVSASKESGEPNHAGRTGGASVWWSFTAPGNMQVVLNTAGSNFDTLLAVYTGSAVNALTEVASNDDFGAGTQSQVTFGAVGGTTYRIAVDGFGGATGSITLALSAANYSIAVSANPAQGGAVTGGGTFNGGTSRTVTATANSGWSFVNWTESGSQVSTNGSYTFTLNANRNLVANFTQPQLTISLSVSPDGSGGVSGAGTFNAGTSRTVTAFPNSGWSFVNWTEGGSQVSTNASYTFTLNANRNLVANFVRQQFTISLSVSPSGSGTVTGAGTFDADTFRTVTATANPGFSFVNWTEGGAAVSGSSSFTFTLIGHRNLVANFRTAVRNDLLADLGNLGLLQFLNNSITHTIFAGSPSFIAAGDLDGGGKDDAIAILPSGTWARYDDRHWARLHPRKLLRLATGDLDGSGQDDLVGYLDGVGLYAFMNNATPWVRLHANLPSQLATGDFDGNGKDDIVAVFANGTWVRYNNSGAWVNLHSLRLLHLVTGDIDGNGRDDIVGDFPNLGLYVYRNNARPWVRLHTNSSQGLATGDLDGNNRDDVIVIFPSGTWARYDNGTWRKLQARLLLHPVTADLDSSGKDDLIGDFAGLGLYVLRNNTLPLVRLRPQVSQGLAAGSFD